MITVIAAKLETPRVSPQNIVTLLYGNIFRYINQGLTLASTIVFDTGFLLSQTDMVVVFTCVLVCDVIVVAQWSRLIRCARYADTCACCFSRRLTFTMKWTCSAVAGMIICQGYKDCFNGKSEINMAYILTSSASSKIRAMSKRLRLRNLIACKTKLIIYKSSILPHLRYCHFV